MMSVRWLGQPIVPFLTPLTAIPIGWPAGVPYPPPQPAWWPAGLQYPPIGDAWPSSPPPWWTAAGASLPNWPPPSPAGWPADFSWPVPPSTVSGSVSCPDLCDAQFGPTGTAPNEGLRTTCKFGCGLAPPSGGGSFPFGSHNLAPSSTTTPSTTTTPEKKSNTGLIVVGVLAAAAIAAFVVFGGAAALEEEND